MGNEAWLPSSTIHWDVLQMVVMKATSVVREEGIRAVKDDHAVQCAWHRKVLSYHFNHLSGGIDHERYFVVVGPTWAGTRRVSRISPNATP
jgi:hypothetical protein